MCERVNLPVSVMAEWRYESGSSRSLSNNLTIPLHGPDASKAVDPAPNCCDLTLTKLSTAEAFSYNYSYRRNLQQNLG